MAGVFLWGMLTLPAAAVCGAMCAAIATAYAQRIGIGAPVDGNTFRAALLAVVWRRPRLRASRRLAVPCAGLLALAWLPFLLQPSILAAVRFAACGVLLVLAVVDARSGFLPDALTLPLLWAGLLLAAAEVGPRLDDAVVAAAVGYLFLRGMNASFAAGCGRAGMGGGDMKLVAALGAWLGWAPLPGVLLGASLGGILFAVLSRGRQAWGTSLPFGPFLAGAGAFGLMGEPVVQFLFCLGNTVCSRSV